MSLNQSPVESRLQTHTEIMSRKALTIINADTATFECIYGRGCEGKCCQNGRPSLSAAEQRIINALLERVLPALRPAARAVVAQQGYLSRRKKLGQPMLRVVEGWCVFFHNGCVLHQFGLSDFNDYTRYKPSQCVMFPLEPFGDGRWYVRQHGYLGERWDLFCLNPHASQVPAVQSLATEIDYCRRLSDSGTETTDRNDAPKTITSTTDDAARKITDSAVEFLPDPLDTAKLGTKIVR
jgi:hypothetical protein